MTVVIVGMGNPGKEYERTRHNAGRMAVTAFAKGEEFPDFVFNKKANAHTAEYSLGGEKVVLVLPETFVNASGKAVAPFVKSVKAAKTLVVVRDDLDLPVGVVKMTFARGSGGHKGVESIMRALKTDAFAQIKIGISPATAKGKVKKPSGEEKVIKHVLGKFSPKEEPLLKRALKKVAAALHLFAEEGMEKAMQEANTR